MKIRHFSLAFAIFLCAVALGCKGAHIKYAVLRPLDLYQDKSIFELPFLMHSDEYLQFMVEYADELKQMEQNDSTKPSTPSTGSTTHPSTGVPTEPSTTMPDSTPPTAPSVTWPSDSDTNSTEGTLDSSVDTSTEPSTEPSTESTTDSTSESTTTPPTAAPPPATEPSTTSGPNFEFTTGVSDDWFENTLFIGDSRVVGLREYARSGNADYFCDVGMNLLSYDDKILSDKNFSSQSLESLLSSKRYDKIIVNFGLNECGFNDYSFKLLYKNFVDMLRQTQPDAIIVLQGIMSVTKSKADTADYFKPSFIAERSAYIASLADGDKIFYIDCNPYFSDENGYLYGSLTRDGYHPTTTGYRYWRDWIAFALEEIGL